jgi:hypothetical protein
MTVMDGREISIATNCHLTWTRRITHYCDAMYPVVIVICKWRLVCTVKGRHLFYSTVLSSATCCDLYHHDLIDRNMKSVNWCLWRQIQITIECLTVWLCTGREGILKYCYLHQYRHFWSIANIWVSSDMNHPVWVGVPKLEQYYEVT